MIMMSSIENRVKSLEALVDVLWKACDDLRTPIGNSDCSCCEDYVEIELPCRDSVEVPQWTYGYWGTMCTQVVRKTLGGRSVGSDEDYPTWGCQHGVIHGCDGPLRRHPFGRCDGCCKRDDFPGRTEPSLEDAKKRKGFPEEKNPDSI